MIDAALDRLAELLGQERQAALTADFDSLVEIQAQKRAVMDRIRELGGDAHPQLARLSVSAQANVGLIRQLVVLTRALAGVDTSVGYGADGRAQSSQGLPTVRGAL